MAETTGLVMAVGGITLLNIWVLEPMAANSGVTLTFGEGWRVIPATAIFALGLAGLEKISPVFAKGLAITALITVLVAPVNSSNSALGNLTRILGYGPVPKKPHR